MLDFFRGKKVFLTGHTGFKGSWLSALLDMAGADVTGFALPPESPSLWEIARLSNRIHTFYGDIRDMDSLWDAFSRTKPEIVLHLAAQPIVRKSYQDPLTTYHTNVMGTVHILECVRRSDSVQSFLNVTTDKVYENHGGLWGCRETGRLNGFDPYSNSKSCSELVTDSYRKSFLTHTAVSTARAGNVIGGGDFASDRILPDCIRAVQSGVPIRLRNPASVRPYQHVLEPLSAYLLIAQRQYENQDLSDCYNVGPDSADCLSAGELAELFCRIWGEGACWEAAASSGPHEDAVLRLDCTKLRTMLNWRPRWQIERAVAETVAWTKAWLHGQNPALLMARQITDFFENGQPNQFGEEA